MAILRLPALGRQIVDVDEIYEYLKERGIYYDRWEADAEFARTADSEAVLQAYRSEVSALISQGFSQVDVMSVNELTPDLDALDDQFAREHTHEDFEIRFFVEGEGVFFLNPGEGESLIELRCVAGDLISLPRGLKHWFEMGDVRHFRCIRFFSHDKGWIPHYTGSDLNLKYRKQSSE
ncbi:MAG: AraC family ligand binding domain-containing protein [Myxococcales bacterium]|nr:AraC family ligand binding domain-containing protein [Myxococcales bacterium]